jgi:uncharacterized protein (TIGR01777 family)
MKIVITGATGFIGSRLSTTLRNRGHQIATLGRGASADYRWNLSAPPPQQAFENAGAIVHLAGEPVSRRWNPEVKRRIRDSRVVSTNQIVDVLATLPNRPAVFVCASAVGYYGNRGDEPLPETAAPGTGFLVDVCREWEAAADRAQALGLRVVKVRIGVVLGKGGGALQAMLPPFKAGLGGPMGSGKQWFPWIHIDDIVGIFHHALDTQVSGPLNGAAPDVVTNRAFAEALGKALHRPALLPTPKFALKLLFGEMADVILSSQFVIPEATLSSGYSFVYPDLPHALASLAL